VRLSSDFSALNYVPTVYWFGIQYDGVSPVQGFFPIKENTLCMGRVYWEGCA